MTREQRLLGWSVAATLAVVLATPSAGSAASLRLVSEPGAEILWEGVSLGRTDDGGLLLVGSIPPGEYEIGARKDGFEMLSRQIEVTEGEQSLELSLVPIAPPSPRRQQIKSAAGDRDRAAMPGGGSTGAWRWSWALGAVVVALVVVGARRLYPALVGAREAPAGPVEVVDERPRARRILASRQPEFVGELRRRERHLEGFVRVRPELEEERLIEVEPRRGVDAGADREER